MGADEYFFFFSWKKVFIISIYEHVPRRMKPFTNLRDVYVPILNFFLSRRSSSVGRTIHEMLVLRTGTVWQFYREKRSPEALHNLKEENTDFSKGWSVNEVIFFFFRTEQRMKKLRVLFILLTLLWFHKITNNGRRNCWKCSGQYSE